MMLFKQNTIEPKKGGRALVKQQLFPLDEKDLDNYLSLVNQYPLHEWILTSFTLRTITQAGQSLANQKGWSLRKLS